MSVDQIVKDGKSSPTEIPARVHVSRGHILKSVLSNWSYLIVNAIVAFVMTPFVVRHLGDSAYGIWALVLQLTGYMGIVDVGLRSALVRFVSSAHAKKDQEGLNRLISSTIMIYGLMAPLSLVVGVLLALLALPRLHIAAANLHSAQITLLLAALIIACDFLFATFHASLAGLSRWDMINALGISSVLVRTTLIVVFIEHGYGLITLALIQLCVNVASYLIEAAMVRHLIPQLKFIWHRPDKEQMRPVLQHSWYSFLLSFANRINYQVDSIVIAAFLPIGEVTYYVIGLRLIEYLRDLLNSTTMVASPLVSSLDAVGESGQVVATLIRGTKYSLIVGFLGVAGFLALGTDFIHIWMGLRFAAKSGGVLMILSLGLLFSGTQFASGHVLYGLGKHRINLNWTIVESILNLALSITLVRRYGILGVAAGTTIANFLIRGWLYPRAVLSALGVSWTEYLKDGIFPAIPPAIAFFVTVFFFKKVFPIQGYLQLIGAVVVGLLPFVACLWLTGLDRGERGLIRNRLKQAVASS
jgi:O-antigen/teichoic acid export membrane protein